MKVSIHFFFKLSILFCLIAAACNNPKLSPELEAKMDTVMAVHDEVMPKMGEIHKLKKQLKKELNKHLEDVSDTRGLILDHITALEDADEGMMTWMADYKKPRQLKESQDPMTYYLGQEKLINKVKDDMLSSINNAQELLNKLGNG